MKSTMLNEMMTKIDEEAQLRQRNSLLSLRYLSFSLFFFFRFRDLLVSLMVIAQTVTGK